MIKDSLSYNPLFAGNDSLSWFRNFQKLQDEAPSGIGDVKDESLPGLQRIIQVKIERPKGVVKSLFTGHELQPSAEVIKTKEIQNPGWVAPTIIFTLFLIALARFGWAKRMQQTFRAFFIGRLFVQLVREGGLFSERGALFLFSSFILSVSLFIFQIIQYRREIPWENSESLLLFIKLMVAVSVFYLLKIAVFRICGFIFKAVKETIDYTSAIFVFGQIAGVIIMPFIILLTYLESEVVIIITLVLFSMLYVYRLFRGVVTVRASSKISMYYIFLYLCTLEFLPLMILARAIVGLKG